MKKLMLLLAIAGMSLGTFAQETTTTEIPTQKHKVVTNGFGITGLLISVVSSLATSQIRKLA